MVTSRLSRIVYPRRRTDSDCTDEGPWKLFDGIYMKLGGSVVRRVAWSLVLAPGGWTGKGSITTLFFYDVSMPLDGIDTRPYHLVF